MANTHIEHPEDIAFSLGESGISAVEYLFEDFIRVLSGSRGISKATLKWDGSPAVFFGWERGRFFVGTKRVATGKKCFTPNDIDLLYHEDKFEILRAKLKLCLKVMKRVTPYADGIWQGDLLFTKETLVYQELALGTRWLTFRANTLTYGVPFTGTIASSLLKCHLGMVIHTFYPNGDMENPIYSPQLSNFGKSKVFLITPIMPWLPTPPAEDIKQAERLLIVMRHYSGKISADLLELVSGSMMQAGLKKAVNDLVRKEQDISNFNSLALRDYFVQHLGTALNKSPAGVARVEKLAQDPTLMHLLEWIKACTDLKKLLMKTLNTRTNDFRCFYKDRFTNHEGYVVHHYGTSIKLVNRLEFSRRNFQKH